MYRSNHTELNSGKAYKYTLSQKGAPLNYDEFLNGLQNDKMFRSFFIELLASIPFRAYHWETPPVSESSLNQPVEFVVSRSPAIDLPPDPGPFRQYFEPDNDIAVFSNLGNDARLIAPVPHGDTLNYSHIGVFTREAPKSQQQALWQITGRVTRQAISDQPLWLNTAGGGVSWLHVRLDSAPKYYMHRPYIVT